MLQKSNTLTGDHGVRLLMLQQHSDHGGLRNVGFDPGDHGQISRVAHQIFGKTGTVIIVHLQDSLLDHGGTSCGGENSHIAPLGMSSQAHGKRILRSHFPDILHRHKLRRNRLLEGHVKVLLPADQGAVGSPEGKKHGPVIQQERHGRKLRLLFRDKLFPIHAELRQTEPVGLRRGPQKVHVAFHTILVVKTVLDEIIRGSLSERYRRIRSHFCRSDIADIRKRRKNKRVHRVDGVLGERKIAAPFYVVKDVCQSSFPLLKTA